MPPAPVRIAQRMSSLESISIQASTIPTNMGTLNAFFFSGRFIVTTATLPTTSKVRFSVPIAMELDPLDDGSGCNRSTTAHRNETELLVGALKFVKDRRDEASSS